MLPAAQDSVTAARRCQSGGATTGCGVVKFLLDEFVVTFGFGDPTAALGVFGEFGGVGALSGEDGQVGEVGAEEIGRAHV